MSQTPEKQPLPDLLESALQRIEAADTPVPPTLIDDLIVRFPEHGEAIMERLSAAEGPTIASDVGSGPTLSTSQIAAAADAGGEGADPSGFDDDRPFYREIGPYKIIDTISRGGQGEVFKALQSEPVQREVALKLFSPSHYSRRAQMRFELEVKAMALMEHSSIAKVYDSGFLTPQQPYLVMELVKGVPLDQYCERNRLTIEERIDLFLQLCQGVQHAHLKGVIHRDLKPSNVLVSNQDGVAHVKLIDFGLARMTQSESGMTQVGELMGTPEYMSPEQVTGAMDVDSRTDIYALGAILYQLLTGHTPIEFPNRFHGGMISQDDLRRIREEVPKVPSSHLSKRTDESQVTATQLRSDSTTIYRRLRGDVDWIVMKALDKSPARRYETASSLMEDIRRFLEDEPVHATPPSVTYMLGKFVKKYRGRVLSAAAVLISSILGTVISLDQYAEAESARAQARHALDEVDLLSYVGRSRDLVRAVEVLGAGAPWQSEEEAATTEWLLESRALVQELEELPARIEALSASVVEGDLGQQLEPEAWDLVLEQLNAMQERELPILREKIGWFGARQDWAAAAADESGAGDPADERWKDAIERIGSSPTYRNLYVEPQLGLVPLGPDPTSGLWEFLHLRSHAPDAPWPERGEDGSFDCDEGTGLIFALIPPGRFTAGLTQNAEDPNYVADDAAESDEFGGPTVTLDGYFLSKYEMNQAQWMRLTEKREEPSKWGPRGSGLARVPHTHPVEQVSWEDCVRVLRSWGLALPTEMQWEYAARAGTKARRWWWGNEEQFRLLGQRVNLADLAAEQVGARGDSWPGLEEPARFSDTYVLTAPVFGKQPNRWGLHHMLGNVWEWCRDYKTPYPDARPRVDDGLMLDQFGVRIVRGGAYNSGLKQARLSARASFDQQNRQDIIGVRPARAILSR